MLQLEMIFQLVLQVIVQVQVPHHKTSILVHKVITIFTLVILTIINLQKRHALPFLQVLMPLSLTHLLQLSHSLMGHVLLEKCVQVVQVQLL